MGEQKVRVRLLKPLRLSDGVHPVGSELFFNPTLAQLLLTRGEVENLDAPKAASATGGQRGKAKAT